MNNERKGIKGEHPVFRAVRVWCGFTGEWCWQVDDPRGNYRKYSHLAGYGFSSRDGAVADATSKLNRAISFSVAW